MWCDSEVSFGVALLLKVRLWTVNLFLNVGSDSPMYVFEVPIELVTTAEYTTFVVRHLPSNGHSSGFRQSHIRSVVSDSRRVILLLCCLMILSILSTQL